MKYRKVPAAFGRLCVETLFPKLGWMKVYQPPSGGCVLKQRVMLKFKIFLNQPPSGGCVLKQKCVNQDRGVNNQPPSGGCVLKLFLFANLASINFQPPSGGCVLKQVMDFVGFGLYDPAAFGRLCVETPVRLM